jgi:eukaryotic-like serine/threonine-protein kinase
MFLAMRWVEGGTLRDLLADVGRLRRERALSILAPVAHALDHAHSMGFVHRDVKPANILIAPDGRTYLSDFGLTRALEERADLTATGGIVGTPLYMAPEQADAAASVGPPCDIYALGCVAFQCLTGEPPYVREHLAASLLAHASADVPSAVKLNSSLPTEIDGVFQTALAKRSTDRYSHGFGTNTRA